MFQVCGNVLTTDLSWPTYQDVVTKQALTSGGHVTTAPLRDTIFHEGWTADDVTSFLAKSIHRQPLRRNIPAGRRPFGNPSSRPGHRRANPTNQSDSVRSRRCRQAFCHVPIDESAAVADFVVTGSHKWMRSGQPMGIGLFGRDSTQLLISNTLRKISSTGGDLDPLLQFTEQLDCGRLTGHSETVNLTSLFSCGAASVTHCENAGFFGDRQWIADADDSEHSC